MIFSVAVVFEFALTDLRRCPDIIGRRHGQGERLAQCPARRHVEQQRGISAAGGRGREDDRLLRVIPLNQPQPHALCGTAAGINQYGTVGRQQLRAGEEHLNRPVRRPVCPQILTAHIERKGRQPWLGRGTQLWDTQRR